MFKNACRIALNFNIHRYLICNTDGRQDGFEKASVHIEMCNFYIAIKYGLQDRAAAYEYVDDFELVHEATQELTSYMDKEIGFPIKGRPDYGKLAPLFFEKFHALAVKSLGIE